MFQLHVSSEPQLAGLPWPWLFTLANIAIASLLVSGLTLLVERFWPRRTLPLRHTILLSGLFVTLAIPAIVAAIDAAGFSLIEIATEQPASTAALAMNPPPSEAIAPVMEPKESADLQSSIAETPAEQGGSPQLPAAAATSGSADHAIERALDPPAEPIFTWQHLLWAGLALTGVWFAGSLYELVRVARGLLHVRRFQRTIRPVTDPRLLRLASAAAQAVGLARCPPLGQSPRIETPVSLGAFHGQVVLPAGQLAEWSDDAWRALLLHEMAHIRRRDPAIGLSQRAAMVLYWWNPLLRSVSSNIAVLREQICDDMVAQHGSQEDRYAALIVELAGRVVTQRQLGPVLGAADGTPSELATRIRRLLDPNRQLATTLSRTMKCAVAAFCIALVLGVGGTSIHWTQAQDTANTSEEQEQSKSQEVKSAVEEDAATTPTPSDPSDTLHKKIRVVDEQGRPIAGATITPWAIRDSLGGHGAWRIDNKGRSKPPILTTDGEGRATLPFPRYSDPAERVPLVQITCRLDHPGFVQTVYNDVRVKESELADEQTLEMTPGAQVEVEALEGDKPISSADLHAIWSSPSQELKATISSDGKLLLPRLPAGDELVRVVYLPRDGDTLFSEVQSLKLVEGERYPLRVAMKPALTISGRIDDSVPRPVKNGRVVAEVINQGPNRHTVEWRTWAEIKEDGTFTLEPVPAGELQVIALCDGFRAADGERPPNVANDYRSPGRFQLPQVFSVSAEHHDVTLKMTPTADCTVRVIDPDGKPVAGAQVGFSPNVGWWNGGSQIYCCPLFRSAEQFRPLTKEEANLRDRLLPPQGPNNQQFFGAKTSADGVAIIRNLPVYDASFAVIHADWELPIDKQSRWGRIQLKSGAGNEITVRVQPKGKDFLGDSAKAAALAPPPAVVPATSSAPALPSEKQVLVLDPDGKPLAGATITPSTVRAKGSRDWLPFGSLTFEPEHPHAVVTDTEGIARVPLPPQVAQKANAINCRVEHPKYAIVRESDVRIDGDFAQVSTIRMQRGARLTITPEAPGVKFDPAALHAMWTGREENFAVHVTDSGQIEMPPLPAGKTMYRVIYLPKDGQAMFSDTQEAQLVNGQPISATVPMHPAVRVAGKFDLGVPRPVTDGIVVAQVLNMYDGNRRLRWRIWTKVAEDGSFVLEPVPRCELQVIGMSNGFTAVSTGRKDYHMRPQEFDVSQDTDMITLQMEPAAELTIQVVNEAGQPVQGAHCMAHPQVNWIGGFGGENQFYCLPRYSSIDMLNGMTIHERARLVPNPSPFSGKTDQKGVAVLTNLPPGSEEIVISGQKMSGLRVELESGARREVTVKFDDQQTANLGIVPTEPVATPVSTSSSPPIEKTAASTKRPAEPAPTELGGVVVDEDGKPLAGVDVDAWTWHAGNETKTDKDGRFVLKGFERNEAVEIEFTKLGYSPALFIEQHAGSSDWNVVLTQGTWLEGQVLDPDGKPVPKALIRAWRGPFRNPQVTIGQVWTETNADEQGRYRLNLEPAAYTIEVRVPNVGTLREANVTLTAKEQKSLDLKLDRGVTFQATVRNSITGQPVEGIVLWNWRQQYSDIKGKSDNEGKLAIEGMMPGEFEFKVSAIGSDRRRSAVAGEYARWWSPQAKNEWQRDERKNKLLKRSLAIGEFQRNFDGLTFDLAGDSTEVEIFVEPAVTITGRVLDPDGNPVAGATVAPAKTGSGNSLTGDTRFSHQTDKEGRFTMKLPASKENPYNLIAHDGKYQQWRHWANAAGENVFTNPGDKIDGVELRLTRGGTVKGRVLNAAGQPRSHVEVRAAAVDKRDNRYYVPTTKTEENGNYELKFISPGEQHIQVAPFWLQADQAPKSLTQVVTIEPDVVVEGIDFKTD